MVHKLALIIGGVGAAAVLALAVVLGGFTAVVTGSADATATDQLVDDFAVTSGTDGTSGKVEAAVDTIFVEASPEPTASPSAGDNGGRSGEGRRGDVDDDHGDRHDGDDDDHDDDDDDRSGHRDGDDDDDDDRSGHRGGDDDRDRDDD